MTPQETIIKLGATIRAHRIQNNLSLSGFSDLTNLEEWFLKELEDGNIDPTMEHIFLITRGLGITTGELFKDFD